MPSIIILSKVHSKINKALFEYNSFVVSSSVGSDRRKYGVNSYKTLWLLVDLGATAVELYMNNYCRPWKNSFH